MASEDQLVNKGADQAQTMRRHVYTWPMPRLHRCPPIGINAPCIPSSQHVHLKSDFDDDDDEDEHQSDDDGGGADGY